MPAAVSILVWNPHPRAYRGPVELEASLDYRPIWRYCKAVDALPVRVSGADGRDIPFQVIETEHHSLVDCPWRRRVLINADLPAWGWNVIEMAYDEAAQPMVIPTQVGAADNQITNGEFQVRATIGAPGIQIERNGQTIFEPPGLYVISVEDPWGSWGGMSEQPESVNLNTVRHRWTISDVRVLELKLAEDGRGLILRVQETAGKQTIPKLRLMDGSVRLKRLWPYQIMTWRLTRQKGRWKATATDAIER